MHDDAELQAIINGLGFRGWGRVLQLPGPQVVEDDNDLGMNGDDALANICTIFSQSSDVFFQAHPLNSFLTPNRS